MPQQAEKTQESSADSIQFSAEIAKVLQLMIHSLYTNKDIFLRELISNASDACDKLRHLALTHPKLLEADKELRITVRADEKENTLEVSDNGIGMNREDLIANLGTIAKSGTLEFLGTLGGDTKKNVNLIGQFGVGFYSSFMVADKVEVRSRKAGEEEGYIWSSDGQGAFTVMPSEQPLPRGTTVKLCLKQELKEYADTFRVRHIVQTYSDHIGFPIFQETAEGEPLIINEGSALWVRPKSDITAEQYHEFYHHVSHSPDTPWLTLHSKAEGMLEYTSLLFVPSMKPFDLFHPERRRRVKLYVKRVFITEENVDIVPHYLRFLRGVIDSEDLPLNISRETLQDNPILKKIREGITSKVLAELKKKAESDKEGFAKFWGNFGAVLKEGLCEAQSSKDKLLEVCRFHSTAGAELTSLDAYVSRMKEGQDEIYYLTGDDVATLKKSPQLEGFVSRGVEVLLLADHVDDFWVNVVPSYKEKTFKSITRANIDLDKFGAGKKEKPAEQKKAPSETKEEKQRIDSLIALLKTSYGEDIKDVRATAKLTDTPACLAVDEHGMDFRMERFLMEHRQLPKRAAKILEINPAHPLVLLMAEKASREGASEDVKDAAQLLLDQARIIEGETVADAAGFARRLARFMQRGLL